MPWYVLYTKPRNEKKVSSQLNEMGIDTYCPVVKKNKKWSDRIKKVEEPLFNSYCFVNINPAERQRVFAVSGVVRYLYWLGQPAVVKQTEIDIIRQWLNEFDHSSITTQSFSVQDRVLFKSGTLLGQTGVITDIHDKKLILLIEGLGLMVSVDTRQTAVEKIIA
jgi:transcription antitermination factor NusG